MRHDLGPLGVGEVEAVGDREGLGTHRAQIPIGLRNRLFAAFIGIGVAVTRGAIGGDRDGLVRAVDADDRCVAAGGLYGIAADLLVILLPNPAPRGDVGAGHQLEQIRGNVGAFGDVTERRNIRPRLIRFTRKIGPFIFRRVIRQRPKRNIAHHFAVEAQHHMAAIGLRFGDMADHREIQLPLLEDCLRKIFTTGLEHHQHPFLTLAQHHFIGRHPGFAARHCIHVEFDANAAFARHFHRRGRQPRCAHILNGDNRIGCHQFKAGLNQQLLGEGIADLNGGALGLNILTEIRTRHRRAVDAVAPGFAANIDDRVADARCCGIENLVGIGDPNGHRVDKYIAIIGLIEINLTADRWHADAIAIAANPANNATNQMLHLRMIRRAKAQRVHIRNRPRTHREDIAQDAANAGRRTLIRLDIAGVIMRLHLENRRLTVANINHARILTGATNHLRASRRQLLQVKTRGFVGAMLRPHHREYPQLGHIRFPPHRVENALILFRGKAVIGDDLGSD